MYKMKQVCQMTGLSEKAVRIYMDQKLIHPKVEEGVHRKAYFFSESDVERLKDILTLRNAGFSIAEIKQLMENPQMLSLLIEEKKAVLEGEIQHKLELQKTLENLTIEAHSDVTKLVDAIEPRSTYAKETPKKKWSRKKKWLVVVILLMVFFAWIWLVNGRISLWVGISAIAVVLGITAVVSGIRYLIYHLKTQKRSSRAIGKITAVVENEKIEEYIGSRKRSLVKDFLAYMLFGMFGEGIWDMLRPDAWYPVVSYQSENGDFYVATTRFGAFPKSWQVGDEVEITWEDGKERLVHIRSGNVFLKKAKGYLLIGLSLLAIFGSGLWNLFGKEIIIDETNSLKYPAGVDRVEMIIDGDAYELDEEEIAVIKKLLDEAEIKSADHYVFADKNLGEKISFYQGDKLVERFIVNNINYIYSMNGMKYWVKPIDMEFRGNNLGEDKFVTVFFGGLRAKVLERYIREAVMECTSEQYHLDEFKQLLNVTEYFEGASSTADGYQLIFSEMGFEQYFGRSKKENEVGELKIYFEDGEFKKAVLRNYSFNEAGEIQGDVYQKEWK